MNLPLHQCLFYSFILLLVSLLPACSSPVPASIKKPLATEPAIQQVRENPESYLSKPVRWGGVILNTENFKDHSRLTIVAYPLNKHGTPLISKNSVGRFIARFNQFLEPKVYNRDRIITVLGNVVKTETINIGEFPYIYPLIAVSQHFLWPVDEPEETLYPPWWYDPYYWPYHPPHRYP